MNAREHAKRRKNFAQNFPKQVVACVRCVSLLAWWMVVMNGGGLPSLLLLFSFLFSMFNIWHHKWRCIAYSTRWNECVREGDDDDGCMLDCHAIVIASCGLDDGKNVVRNDKWSIHWLMVFLAPSKRPNICACACVWVCHECDEFECF